MLYYYEWLRSHKRHKDFLMLMGVAKQQSSNNTYYVKKIYFTAPDWNLKEGTPITGKPNPKLVYNSLKQVKQLILMDLFEKYLVYPIALERY